VTTGPAEAGRGSGGGEVDRGAAVDRGALVAREVDRVADAVAAAVVACPLVAGLHGGRYGQITTYLPGRRVPGVSITEDEARIGVVARYPAALDALGAQVRTAVTSLIPAVPVSVSVEDVTPPPAHPDAGDLDPGPPGAGRPVTVVVDKEFRIS